MNFNVGPKTLSFLAGCALTAAIFSMGFFQPKDALHPFMLMAGVLLGMWMMGTMMYGYGRQVKEEEVDAVARRFTKHINNAFEQIMEKKGKKKDEFVPMGELIEEPEVDEEGYVTDEYVQRDPNWWKKGYKRRPE